jgi:hypothetical protein
MHFRTTILQGGKTATGIEVPPEIVEELGSGKRPAVRVTINGHIVPEHSRRDGGKFMIGVSAEVREAAGVAGGDSVDVALELATPRPAKWRCPTTSPQRSRRTSKPARSSTRSPTAGRLGLVAPVANGKTPETRQRNIDKALAELRK